MRAIAETMTETEAKRLGDVLLVQGIDNEIRSTREGSFHLWVHDERQVDRAKELVEEVRRDPDADRFRLAEQEAGALRRERQREVTEAVRREVNVGKKLRQAQATGMGMVSTALIVISVGVAVLTGLGDRQEVVDVLSIAGRNAYAARPYGLGDVLSGEVWRLVTPIFLHFGLLHLVFNMLWLRDLGSRIERVQAPWFLGLFVLVVAVASNLAELLIGGSSHFGGMSGVVYGLLGYVWMRGRFDIASGYSVSRTTVGFMMVWFVLCWSGMVGHVANLAHTGGLVVGAAWGYVAAVAAVRGRRPPSHR